MNKKMRPLWALLPTAWLLSACSLTPVYQRPPIAAPDQWVDGVPSAATGASSPLAAVAADELPWSRYFPDPRLQRLIRQALGQNRDLRVAMLNVEQVRAQYQIQQSERFPTLNGSITGTRQPSTVPPNEITSVYTAGVGISAFELDLFGRLRALSESAAAQLLSTQEARKAAHISLVSSVANAYYALWADRWQLALAEQTVLARQEGMKLLQLKYDNGVLNELDWRSAQSLVEAARIARAQAQRQWAQDLNALNLLLGGTAPADALPPAPDVTALAASSTQGQARAAQPGDDTPPSDAAPDFVKASLWPDLSELPVGLPSDVLLKRPDIAQAEQQLISANANIGAARAARFPRISLTASAGLVSDSLSNLFSDGRSAWSFSPQLSVPLFDAGRGRAQVESAQVRKDIAIAQYDRAIQGAFREVADALVARSSYAEQAQAQLAQTEAEAARLRLSGLRYRSGVASQLDLLDAQRALLASQQALISAQLARQQAHITLYRALGGGWLGQEGTPR